MFYSYSDLPDDLIKAKVTHYCYDYFFHYLLIQSDRIRLALCQYMSEDYTIKETYIENSESYKPYYYGKKLIMDIVVKDDQDRYYNFEMQNYDILADDELRFSRYIDRLFDRQEKKGIGYDEMKDVYQLILYTGKPIKKFNHYQHIIIRGDFNYKVVLENQKAHTTLLQLRKMKEDLNMEIGLNKINQLAYLFMNNKPHENSEMCEEVEEAVQIHNKYMRNDEIIKGYELERERMVIKTKTNIARKEGLKEGRDKGKKEECYNNVLQLVELIYGVQDNSWIDNCSYEQLSKAFQLVKQGYTYEQLKAEMLK